LGFSGFADLAGRSREIVKSRVHAMDKVRSLSLSHAFSLGQDVSRHQQEVTDGQLVTMSLVPGTIESDVALECHLGCPLPLPTEEVSSVDSS